MQASGGGMIKNDSEKIKLPFPQMKRYVWVLAGVWTIVIAGSLIWHSFHTKQETLEVAQTQARVAYEKDIIYRRWNAGYGGVYVLVTKETQPNPYLSDVPERDITTPSGKALTLMNPAYMTRQAHELEKQKLGVRGHITSLNPIRPENAPDPWETEALRAFGRGETEINSVEEIQSKKYMRLMRPLITEKSCLKCHAKQGYHEGDIRGGISVSIPIDPLLAFERKHILTFTLIYGLLWMVGLGGIGLGTQRLMRTERERRRAEEALQKAHGELERKVEERTADLSKANIFLEQEISERKRAEEYLAQSEANLRAVFDGARDGILAADAQIRRFVFANEAICRMLGYSHDDMLRLGVEDIHPAEDLLRVQKQIERQIKGEISLAADIPIKRKDGSVFYADINSTAVEFGGRPCLIGVFRDITERKQAEETLRGEKNFIEDALNSLSDVFFVFDLNGKFLRWNKTTNAVSGYSDAEIPSMQPAKFFLKEDKQRVMDAIKMVVKEGYASIEATVVTKEGRHIPYEFTGTLLRNYEGKSIGVCGVGRDITERKKMEEEVKASEKKYRSLVESALIGVYKTHLKGDFLYVNEAMVKMFEFESPEELISFGVLPIYKNLKDREVLIENLKNTGKVDDFELEVLTKTGKTINILMNATLDGDFISGMFIDITERKKAEEKIKEYTETLEEKIQERTRELEDINLELQALNKELELKSQEAEIAKLRAMEASRAKSDFLANMSHELRTPLNSVIGFSEILQDGLYGELNEKQREYVNDISSSGQHLLNLINDILDLSKVEAGKMELELSRFTLSDVLNTSMTMLKEKAIRHMIRLNLEIEPDADIEIEADERKLKQILFNLLSNAVKFTPDGGSITVHALILKLDGAYIEISVEDTGIGIRPEDMDKLFQEFSQIETPYEKKYEGTGLGLALIKKLVELHGGKIWVESEFGKGSKFMFVIPARQEG